MLFRGSQNCLTLYTADSLFFARESDFAYRFRAKESIDPGSAQDRPLQSRCDRAICWGCCEICILMRYASANASY